RHQQLAGMVVANRSVRDRRFARLRQIKSAGGGNDRRPRGFRSWLRSCRGIGADNLARSRVGRGIGARSELVNDRRETSAIDKLHCVVVDSVIASYAEDGNDMRVVQLRGRLGLDLKTLALFGVDRSGEWKDFQCNMPAERNLLRFIDDSHAP